MRYPMYSIRDAKVGFMTPTIDQNDAAAARNFEHAILNAASLMNSHPGDYALYRIGEFDTESGAITGCMPEHVMDAVGVVK